MGLAACGPAWTPDEGEATSSTASAIYAGVVDDDAQQNASVVAVTAGPGPTVTLCSGALIAPNVVLTARHCVSVESSTNISCDQNGVSLTGDNFTGDQPVGVVRVFTGPAPNLAGTPSATARALYHPAGNVLCNADVALIVLDHPITTVAPMRVRLAGPVATGDSVRAVGYGQNDQNTTQTVGLRYRKDGVTVLAVGSTVSASQTPLGASEFEVGESMCGGDSGGPAISEKTGAIVGVVSRGGACTDQTGHVYTTLTAFQTVFQAAFADAGGAPYDENGPQPTVDGGTPMADDAGTLGGSSSGGSSGSSSGASSGGNGYGGDVNLHSGQGKGCNASGTSPARDVPGAMIAVGLAAFAWFFARRRARQ
ncbi:MAG TPA: trypsin-like serine protease [Polyangiaceae bacterium]